SAFAGASSLFGKVTVVFEPLARSEPISAGTRLEDTIRVLNELDAEKLPHAFAAAAERGIRNALTSGDVGYPVMSVQAAIVDGRWDAEHSTETAFEAAGTDAVRQALRENIVLLEPTMWLEVAVPEEYLGNVTSDLS